MAVEATGGVSGLDVGAVAAGGRSARPVDSAATTPSTPIPITAESASPTGREETRPQQLVVDAYPAQAVTIDNGEVGASYAARSPQDVVAAYQKASMPTALATASEVELPGLPRRLASGRLVDFST